MYLLTTSPSKTRDSTGTTEIGLKSPGPVGVFVLATGWMRATRHCSGMVEELSGRLKRRAIHPEQTGARRRRNQAGMWSRPSAVGFSLSRMQSAVGFSLSRMQKMLYSLQRVVFALRTGSKYSVSVDAAA